MPCSLRRPGLLAFVLFLLLSAVLTAQSYTKVVVFGDSLSDTGNIAHLTQSKFGVRLPSPAFGYTDGRFTDGTDTLPAATLYSGLWIEQLAGTLVAKPAIKNSLDGGTNYAYGDAFTSNGSYSATYGTGGLSVTVNNMGQQVTDYLSTAPVIDGNTLFVVWGGSNDVLNATAATDVATAAANELALIQRLIAAGATDFLIPNLPPLGAIPRLNGNAVAAAQATAASGAYGAALFQGLQGLPAANPGKTLHLFPLDVFTLFNQVIATPATYLLDDVTSTSQFRSVNPDRYLFWEDLHPTTAGHHLLAAAAAKLIVPVIAATTTTLTASATGSNLNANLTFTATTTSSAAAPTGTVAFMEGSTTLGTGSLSAAGASAGTTATATFQTATLAAGSHTITASYPSTGNFAASASNAVTVTVTAPAFTAAIAPTALTVARGASGTAVVTVTPVGGYSGSIGLACGTLPAHMSCNFSSATLAFTGDNTAQSSTVTLRTQTTSGLTRLGGPASGLSASNTAAPMLCAIFLPGGVLLAFTRRRKRGKEGQGLPELRLLLLVIGASAVAALAGCAGSDDRTPAGNYTVPVTVTAGTSVTTLNLQVAVQ